MLYHISRKVLEMVTDCAKERKQEAAFLLLPVVSFPPMKFKKVLVHLWDRKTREGCSFFFFFCWQ